jgi:VanZ family protein
MGGGDHDGRRRASAWIALLGWIGLVLWLGGTPFAFEETRGPLERLFLALGLPESLLLPGQMLVRKSAHVAEYAVLGLLAHRALRGSPPRRATLWAAALAFSVAAFDETRQLGLAERTGAATDVALDVAGACLGIAVARGRLARGPEART